MSVLANEIYDYLHRTAARVLVHDLMTKFGAPRKLILACLNELLEAGRIVKEKGTKYANRATQYYDPSPQSEAIRPLVMRPYKQPDQITLRQRELEAHRAAFPSRFN